MKRIVLAFAIVAALSSCGVAGGGRAGDQTAGAAAKGGESAATLPVRSPAARPVWINSLQMITARDGWALLTAANPADTSALDVAHTSDGGRSWHLITPISGRAELSEGATLLFADSAQRAWVVGASGQTSVVFGTADGGRTWFRSESIAGAEPVAVAFTGDQGWLVESLGIAMSQNPVRVYRSPDGGRSWSLAARSARLPGDPPSGSGLPLGCDKTGIAASPAGRGGQPGTGWITGFCPGSLADAVLVSRDGGAHWASPTLPIPPSVCEQSGCDVAEPQFAGRSTFLVIWAYPDQALLLVTTDGGANWRTVIMPAGAGPYPRVRFFGPADGIAISAGPQGSIGRVFYLTVDGGRSWRPVAQGIRFDGTGTNFDFVTQTTGFAWTSGEGSTSTTPVMRETSSSGRSWASFVPGLG